MKIQDVIFIFVLLFLFFSRKNQWLTSVGICCLVLAIPLFTLQIFFTAERMVYYAAGFLLLSSILLMVKMYKK